MEKNSLRPIPSKQIVYEEDFSMDQMSFASHKTPPVLPITKSNFSKPSLKNNKLNLSLLIHNNLSKHNTSPTSYCSMISDIFISKKPSHLFTIYNEMKICNSDTSVLRRFYELKESNVRLPRFEFYYKHYLKLLAKPTFNSESMNNLIHDTAKEKAQLYFDMVYGRGKKNKPQKEEKNNIDDIIFDSYIKETIENYSTTMTCESNEKLVYPSEIYKKCAKTDVDFSESEIGIINNNNKSNLFLQDNNESILVIMRDLKNRSRSKSKSKPRSKMNIRFKTQQNLGINYKDFTHSKKKSMMNTMKLPNYSIDKSKKISFININPNNKQNEKKYKYLQKMNSLHKSTIKQQVKTEAPNNKTAPARKSKHNQVLTLQQLSSNIANNVNTMYKNYTNSYKTRKLSELETKSKTNVSVKTNEINTCTAKSTKISNELIKLYNENNKSKSPNRNTISTTRRITNPNCKSAQNFALHFFPQSKITNIKTNNNCYKELYKHKKEHNA